MKRSWIKRIGKSERSKLIKSCDDIFRKILLLRDKCCQYSGRHENLQVSHYITRENLHLRWNFDNCHIINGGVHIFLFHKRPHVYKEWLIRKIGIEKVEWLEMQDKTNCQPLYTYDIKMKKLELSEELKLCKQ